MTAALLEVEELSVSYPVRTGLLQRRVGFVRAVDRVSFSLNAGETLGLVGESGCGKSTLGRAVVGLVQPAGGTVRFAGTDRREAGARARREMRRAVQIVFQDPVGSLNPRFRVRDIVLEGRRILRLRDGRSEAEILREILPKVGLSTDVADRFPHELSGGQRQRVGIARTLVVGPRLIVADEPVSALDVSVQSQVLNLFVALQRESGLALLFVAHNLAVVAYIADRIAVMYLGRVVELAPSEAIVARPLHPYTVALLSSVPDIPGAAQGRRVRLSGEPPSPVAPPSGCHFRTRCPIAQEVCAEEEPRLLAHGTGHEAACHFAGRLTVPPAARPSGGSVS